jgi:hypothetical protein
MSPTECLQKQLDTWESALQHSHKSYQKGSIGKEIHDTHVNNLEPKILEYIKTE